MYVRESKMQGDPARIDDVIEYVRHTVMPTVDAQPGSFGLGMWVNRDTGASIVVSVWADEAARAASESAVTDQRSAAAALAGATSVSVEHYETVLVDMKGPHQPGDIMRLLRITGDPATIDENTAWAEQTIVPALSRMPGYLSYVISVNRQTGTGAAGITYRGRDAAEQGAAAGAPLREASEARGMQIVGIEEYEVAIVGIRAPVDVPGQRTVELPKETTV